MQELQEMLTQLETADNVQKNEIENKLVNIGTLVLPELVEELQVVKGVKRGVVAMTLIRIGEAAIEYLQNAAKKNEDFRWIAKYLITEINGTQAA